MWVVIPYRARPQQLCITAGISFWLLLAGIFSVAASDPGRQILRNHVPEIVTHLQPIGLLSVSQRLNLAIGLPLRNQAALDVFLQQLYDPASPNYHRYLTPDQFTEKFCPTEQDYEKVVFFAQAHGLKITARHANRILLDVNGSVADVEKAFQLTLRVYQHPKEQRTFYSPDVEPSVDLGVPVADISGLNNYLLPHPKVIKFNSVNVAAKAAPKSGSGSGGTYLGNDFRAAYVPGTTLDGSGQTIGLLEFDGFYANDIVAYENLAGLPNVPVQADTLDNVSGIPGYSGVANANVEVSLDIEMAISMAPRLSEVVVYEGNNPNDILNAMAANNQIKQFSSSWGWGGGPNQTTDAIFKTMAAQGQSFFNASGDSDAFTTGEVDSSSFDGSPSSSPYITEVGGTTLTTTSPGGAYASETVWNWGNGTGSSGGISSFYAIPSWQMNVDMTANGGSTTFRNIPDVALTADNVYVAYGNGTSETVGGTSCAAPLWAGFMALVNQQAAEQGQSSEGFINPAIYAIAQGANYTSCFNDITTGNNTSSASPNLFFATNGYDLCTGLGTPNGQVLINALVPPDTLTIAPLHGFSLDYFTGSLFFPPSQNLFLTNSGASPLTWSLINTSSWLNASVTGDTLAVGAVDDVAINLNEAVNNLAPGVYVANIQFTNWDSHMVQSLQFSLQVLEPLAVTPATSFTVNGQVGGPFSLTSQNFLLTNSGMSSLDWSLAGLPDWLNVSMTSGTLSPSASSTLTVGFNSTSSNLVAGIYTANLTFTDLNSGGVQTLPFTLSLGQSIVQNGGFETGDFSSWTLTGINAASYNGISSTSPLSPHSGTYTAALGEAGSFASLSQTLPTVPGQNYVLSIWLENPSSKNRSQDQQFLVNWNTNALAPNTIFNQAYSNVFGWTNMVFRVAATGNSTVLQFQARNDPYWFGLDDIAVTPIPIPVLQAIAGSNNTFQFTWNALTNLMYQVQYKTNLSQGDWINLGTSIKASTSILTATNAAGSDPQRFYRVIIP